MSQLGKITVAQAFNSVLVLVVVHWKGRDGAWCVAVCAATSSLCSPDRLCSRCMIVCE